MKLIKIYKALIFATLTIVLVSCQEEVSKDYREEYIGNFYFKVISNSWTMESSHNDTSYYHGYIRKFETADLDADMYYEDDDSTQNPDSSITIKFADYRVITTLVENNGKLVDKIGYHYYQQGEFIGLDSISFSITGLGGLGGGSNYYIYGIRE